MKRQIALAVLCAGAALFFLELGHRRQPDSQPAVATSEASQIQPRTSKLADTTSLSGSQDNSPALVLPDALTAAARMKPPPPQVTPSEQVPPTPESTSLAPEIILENMSRTIRQYASEFGENPVGTNPEITSALQGDNPKHINFLKADGNRVNGHGELVDAWGTPYFFHQISGHEMELRSAGPDRVMYTADDLVTR